MAERDLTSADAVVSIVRAIPMDAPIFDSTVAEIDRIVAESRYGAEYGADPVFKPTMNSGSTTDVSVHSAIDPGTRV